MGLLGTLISLVVFSILAGLVAYILETKVLTDQQRHHQMDQSYIKDDALSGAATFIGGVLALFLFAAFFAIIYGLITDPVVTLFLIAVSFFGGVVAVVGVSFLLLGFLFVCDLFCGDLI